SRTGCSRSTWPGRSRNGWSRPSRSKNTSDKGNNRTRRRRFVRKESRAMTDMTNVKKIETEQTAAPAMTPDARAHLGDGRMAYVKTILSENVKNLFPQAPQIAPGIKLFSLHAADGTPIMLTDTREAAVANAWSQELEAVSVH